TAGGRDEAATAAGEGRRAGEEKGLMFMRVGVHSSAAIAATLLLCAVSTAAQPPSKDQRKCLKAMSAASAKLIKAQQKALQKCTSAAAKGKLPAGQTVQQCLTLDAAGKLAKAAASASAKAAKACEVAPAFGFAGPDAVVAASIGGTLASI